MAIGRWRLAIDLGRELNNGNFSIQGGWWPIAFGDVSCPVATKKKHKNRVSKAPIISWGSIEAICALPPSKRFTPRCIS